MVIPDVVGYRLDKARTALRKQGFDDFTIKMTAPPRESGTGYDDTCRVVRVRLMENNRIEMVLCKPL